MDQSTFRQTPDIYAHTGFLLAEEDALKSYLEGMNVPDRDPTTTDLTVPVKVWFRWPEEQRQISYPFITIDAISAELDNALLHSDHVRPTKGMYQPSVSPELPPPAGGWAAQDYAIRNFWPFILTFQVSVFSRHNLHDRFLRSQFITDVFPPRPFWIPCEADDTWRRVELTGSAQRNRVETTEADKRIFQRVYTITMMAEVPQDTLADATFYKVFRLHLSAKDREAVEQYFEISHEGLEVTTPT